MTKYHKADSISNTSRECLGKYLYAYLANDTAWGRLGGQTEDNILLVLNTSIHTGYIDNTEATSVKLYIRHIWRAGNVFNIA